MSTYVFFTCLLAASGGGLTYGYDLAVAGGVSIMQNFLLKFHPAVYRNEQSAKHDNYCKYGNQVFQLSISTLYIPALLARFLAGSVTHKWGPRSSMLIAGILSSFGTIIGSAAQNLAMLMLGRFLLRCGLGFSNQAIPIYLSEIATPSYRGGLNLLFSINIALGIFGGNLVNCLASHNPTWGWRLSLAMGGVPSFTITLAALILVDTPTFLIRENRRDEAKRVLQKLRGHPDIAAEYAELVKAMEVAEHLRARSSIRNLFYVRNSPQLTMAVVLPLFQQFSGSDAILFYGPFLFKAAGLAEGPSLYSALITGSVVVVGTVTSVVIVNQECHRTILIAASAVMFGCMVAVGTIANLEIKATGSRVLSPAGRGLELAIICLFVFACKAAWEPIAAVIRSEIFPLDIRAPAQSVGVISSMVFKFIIRHTFLSMLCTFKFGIFFFFAGWLLFMAAFTLFFVPDTKGIPVEDMVDRVWLQHWFWKSFITVPEGVGSVAFC